MSSSFACLFANEQVNLRISSLGYVSSQVMQQEYRLSFKLGEGVKLWSHHLIHI